MSLTKLENRLVSIDFFRGFVMFLLIAEFAHVFEVLFGNDDAVLQHDKGIGVGAVEKML